MTTIVLDDGIEYMIIDTVELDGNVYTLFSELNNDMNFCFRKITYKNGEKYYSGLEDREEFKRVLLEFANKIDS